MHMTKNHRRLLLLIPTLLTLLFAAGIGTVYLGEWPFNRYFDRWGAKLVAMEKRGLLSTEFGAAWQDILSGQAMSGTARELVGSDTPDSLHDKAEVTIVDGVRINDYPSLSLVARLNQVSSYSNAIEIVDRKNRMIATIRTDHTRGKINEFPSVLITALIAAEDAGFYTDQHGFSYKSYVRAGLRAAQRSIATFSLSSPRGTSTITQQVAKLFISDIDQEGRRRVSRSIDRKLREMRIASALRKMYTPNEILEVYLNHCVTSDYGLIGIKDIAEGLFGKSPQELNDAECLYLARMVKWGRNLKKKIVSQCKTDLPRMAAALQWDENKQARVLAQIESLTFSRPQRVSTDHGQLVDLANEFWLKNLERAGMTEHERASMNIIDPNSLIRKKGNLRIRLTIDLPLQCELERLVNTRGYGEDTLITTDARVGSQGTEIERPTVPADTIRFVQVLDEDRDFSEPGASYSFTVKAGDTLVTNIRYKKTGRNRYRRSLFFYSRRPFRVNGQYFAYSIMDSRTGELRACYSRDRIGSRMASLLRNHTPNGSSTAKPIFNALMFDRGIFEPTTTWSDTILPPDTVPWARTFDYSKGHRTGVIFQQSAVKGRGYAVHNHGHVFAGCAPVFDHLSSSNNILGVETCYRLDCTVFDKRGRVTPEGFKTAQFLSRIGAFGRIKDSLKMRTVTGVRVYKELARIVGVDIDSMESYSRRIPVSDSLYSVALGTLELTLLEQMHLFNVLYDNNLIENPAQHPSLFVNNIVLNDRPLTIPDTVRLFHPFNDISALRPTWLGLHLRLVSNRWDNLEKYDLAYNDDSAGTTDTVFDANRFVMHGQPSNFAKSGTSDDIIRPFNTDPASKVRTNFGLWNAVVRVDLARFSANDSVPEPADLTIACIGECNTTYTGARDGKTLHKFLTRGLLKKAGIPAKNGYFSRYEHYLRQTIRGASSRCE